MFLGGLTARAVQLKQHLQALDISVVEVYPSALARKLQLNQLAYKKEKKAIQEVVSIILQHFPYSTEIGQLPDWHHVDALLCLFSGDRYLKGTAEAFGDAEEGRIHF